MSKGGLRAALLAYLAENADEAGMVREPIDAIRLKLGVSRHDLIKAVWDLKALGRLGFTEIKDGGSSYPDRLVLRGRNPRWVTRPHGDGPAQLVLDWVRDHGGAEGGPVQVQPKALAGALGVGYSTLLYNLNAMAGRGQVSLHYHGGGPRARIEGLSVPAWRPRASQGVPGGPEKTELATGPSAAIKTPLLDAYRAAKAAADANPGNPYLHFEYSAIAEEGLALLEGANR